MGRSAKVIAAVASSLLVLFAGIVGAFTVFGNDSAQSSTCERSIYNLRGDLVATGGSIWPLGRRCTYRLPDGMRKVVVVPAAKAKVIAVVILTLVSGANPFIFLFVHRGR